MLPSILVCLAYNEPSAKIQQVGYAVSLFPYKKSPVSVPNAVSPSSLGLTV
jgi:hypothetical protein